MSEGLFTEAGNVSEVRRQSIEEQDDSSQHSTTYVSPHHATDQEDVISLDDADWVLQQFEVIFHSLIQIRNAMPL